MDDKSQIPVPQDLPNWAKSYKYLNIKDEVIAHYVRDNYNKKWRDILPIEKAMERVRLAQEELAKL